jgi:hypothetical protein
VPRRVKLVEFFRPHPLIDSEQQKALRVSRYLGVDERERQVRFSVWRDLDRESAQAESAVSLDEAEADRLARFLTGRRDAADDEEMQGPWPAGDAL